MSEDGARIWYAHPVNNILRESTPSQSFWLLMCPANALNEDTTGHPEGGERFTLIGNCSS